jgi:hypothetical protein
MATSKPNTLQVSDLVQWYRSGELVINDTFQRHSIWTTAAKTFLIDTILHELPVPTIFIRTKIDPKTQKSVREVVDGQQRVRTFVEFANDQLTLTNRSDEYAGLRYSGLEADDQRKFLGYTISVAQLLNATDDDVIDIFARLNSYTVALNAAEKRHAKYQTEFKFAVRAASQNCRWFIEKYDVFSTRKRFRMADDVFFAEVYGLMIDGIKDGGDRYLKSLYESQTDDVFDALVRAKLFKRISAALKFLDSKLGNAIKGEFSRHYHLLMLIAAYLHSEYGIPQGDLDELPDRKPLASADRICDRLATLDLALTSENPPKKWAEFVKASSARPYRIASRKVRFPVMWQALVS